MIDSTLDSSQLLFYTIEHYIKNTFSPLNIEFETANKRISYIYENALHLNLGKNVDHLEFGLFLAANSPYYGIVIPDKSFVSSLRNHYRPERFSHTKLPVTVQPSLSKLPTTTQVLVILHASRYRKKIPSIIANWTTTKPLLLIG
jgi:hypothetical protein